MQVMIFMNTEPWLSFMSFRSKSMARDDHLLNQCCLRYLGCVIRVMIAQSFDPRLLVLPTEYRSINQKSYDVRTRGNMTNRRVRIIGLLVFPKKFA